jgi:hypothetical protein
MRFDLFLGCGCTKEPIGSVHRASYKSLLDVCFDFCNYVELNNEVPAYLVMIKKQNKKPLTS